MNQSQLIKTLKPKFKEFKVSLYLLKKHNEIKIYLNQNEIVLINSILYYYFVINKKIIKSEESVTGELKNIYDILNII